MKGLIEEGAEKIEELEKGSTLDAALIASAQKVEHYEIATYGTLATFAEVLNLQEAKDLLGQTLEEEKEADEKLTGIAGQINPEAETEEARGARGRGRMAVAGSRSAAARTAPIAAARAPARRNGRAQLGRAQPLATTVGRNFSCANRYTRPDLQRIRPFFDI